MGFELNRIMKQYGVGTPTMANYTGSEAPSAPKEPVAPPVGSDEATSGLYPGAQTKYKADLAAYQTSLPELTRKYDADRAAYDTYKTTYQNRLQNTPMYTQGQFQAAPQPVASTVSDLYKMYLGRDPEAGIVGSAPASTRPDFMREAQPELNSRPGFGNQNLMNATGSYYGNQLRNPVYSAAAAPAPTTSQVVANTPDVNGSLNLNRPMGDQGGNDAGQPGGGWGGQSLSEKAGFWGLNPGWATAHEKMLSMIPFDSAAKRDEQLAIDMSRTIGPSTTTAAEQATKNALADSMRAAEHATDAGDRGGIATGGAQGTDGGRDASGGGDRGTRGGYAYGGQVKTHYQTAGAVKLPSGYGSVEEEEDFKNRFFQPSGNVATYPVTMDTAAAGSDLSPAPVAAAPRAPLTEIAASSEPGVFAKPAAPLTPAAPVAAPVTPAAAVAMTPKAPGAVPFGGERMGNIQALLATYGPKDSAYAEDLKTARASAKAESDAFAKMLSGAMKSPEDEQSSKAEMYFRLASAFGAPTKTGQFSENLGMVGKELGEFAKNKRAAGQQKLALALEGQKMKMTAAKEDLGTLRALASEEMKDKRTIAAELIKDYIKSGEPQSTAGKQALDEGLKPGSPEYQKRVAEIGNLNVEGKMAQINASLAGISLASANLALNQEKFNQLKTQQAKLSPAELKLKTDAEDLIASSKQSLADLKRAYTLNPNSLAGGWLDKGQQFLSEAAGSKDPTIVNTRILNNLLGSQGLAKLKATFGGAPTEGERAILMELEGIGAKTKEERGDIIKRTYKVLQDRVAREQNRLDQVTSGSYRTTTPLEGGTE